MTNQEALDKLELLLKEVLKVCDALEAQSYEKKDGRLNHAVTQLTNACWGISNAQEVLKKY